MTKKIRILYTSPLSGGFVLACTAVLLLSRFVYPDLISAVFSAPARHGSADAFNWMQPFDFLRLFIHIFAHTDAVSFGANAALVLLLGPRLEERYGAAVLSVMIIMCAFVSGVCNVLFSSSVLCGADGVVFLMIILYTFAYAKKEGLLFTNLLLFILYLLAKLFPLLGTSFYSAQTAGFAANYAWPAVFAHLAGGLCGSLFAFASVSSAGRSKKQ